MRLRLTEFCDLLGCFSVTAIFLFQQERALVMVFVHAVLLELKRAGEVRLVPALADQYYPVPNRTPTATT